MPTLKIITDPRCTEYHKTGHPERPQRVSRSVEHLKAQTKLAFTWAEPLPESEAAILRAHTPEALASLATQTTDFDADTAAHPNIDAHARRSVGAALQALACAQKQELGFSLMRPPGHHAVPKHPMGFCYLNNVAIAALAGQAAGFKRVAVFDFDVHHGNGTEDIFLGKKDVAFFSVHQSPAYPGTGLGHRGTNCFNYPVEPDALAATYRAACSAALKELQKFKPDLVAVSAGFDAFEGDLLCQQNLEREDFQWIGEQVRALHVPTFSLLEGGYSKALPELITAYLQGWSGQV